MLLYASQSIPDDSMNILGFPQCNISGSQVIPQYKCLIQNRLSIVPILNPDGEEQSLSPARQMLYYALLMILTPSCLSP